MPMYTITFNIITQLNNQYTTVCLYDQVWLFRYPAD